ncbi:hypothetical protein SET4581_02594 [Salmonella enterica subsp. enterica serovar Typhimurium str. ST4581]|nr:hypothetical protein SET4581_02594 [Salmonella enterica subsp. enterica serovar Typhimurium str. ST4581]
MPMLPRELSDDLCSLRANEVASGARLSHDNRRGRHH